MKKIFIFAAAAAMLASCSQDVIVEEMKEASGDKPMVFSAGSEMATRAENSGATAEDALKLYHSTFKLWGYKNVSTTETEVFKGQVLTWADSPDAPFTTSGDWTYSPLRYWDKSADDYDFYAVAPSTAGFVEAGTPGNYYFTLPSYTIDGRSLYQSTGDVHKQPKDLFGDDNATNKDYMIATDQKGWSIYTAGTHVDLHFNHILSRFNIGVKTSIPASVAKVTLNKVIVEKMQSKGDFDESRATGTELQGGTDKRWNTASYNEYLTVGYDHENPKYINSSINENTLGTTDYLFFYQGLAIPQTVKYTADVKTNGSNLGATPEAYLYINYTIEYVSGEKETNFAYYNLAQVFNQKLNEPLKISNGAEAYKTTDPGTYIYYDNAGKWYDKDGNELDEVTENEEYKNGETTYTLVTPLERVFVKDDADASAVTFCEGWQNTLKINIAPNAILFSASVYEWDTKEEVAIDIQ